MTRDGNRRGGSHEKVRDAVLPIKMNPRPVPGFMEIAAAGEIRACMGGAATGILTTGAHE